MKREQMIQNILNAVENNNRKMAEYLFETYRSLLPMSDLMILSSLLFERLGIETKVEGKEILRSRGRWRRKKDAHL